MTHQVRSAKNIVGNSLHSKPLILRYNPDQIFPEPSDSTRPVDIEPILYCPANSLIPKGSSCAKPYLVNYPGFRNGPSGVKPLE
jgi:hypothetical protein